MEFPDVIKVAPEIAGQLAKAAQYELASELYGKLKAANQLEYCKEALRQDLLRVRIAWEECQSSRDRNAIYGYLSAVFELVAWWAAEGQAVSRARRALRLCRLDLPNDEPFAAIILCTADRQSTSEHDPSGRA
jgi:hypothetical protein